MNTAGALGFAHGRDIGFGAASTISSATDAANRLQRRPIRLWP